jgi:hypothetical protein
VSGQQIPDLHDVLLALMLIKPALLSQCELAALFLGAAPPSSSPLYMPTPPNDLQLMSRVVAVDEEIIARLQRRERQHPSSNGSSRATSKRVSLPHPSTQGG